MTVLVLWALNMDKLYILNISPGAPWLDPEKIARDSFFWTMLFLKVSKTILVIQESRKIQSWEIWVHVKVR